MTTNIQKPCITENFLMKLKPFVAVLCAFVVGCFAAVSTTEGAMLDKNTKVNIQLKRMFGADESPTWVAVVP